MWTKVGALVALAGMACAAPAQASCWEAAAADAAAIRDLQTMLMVATLRCRAAGLGTQVGYDVFVMANRGTLDGANAAIRAHFEAEQASEPAQVRYDRFTTLLANGYGASATTPRSCAAAAEMTLVATAAGSREGLLRVASARGARPVEVCRPANVAVGGSALPGVAEATPAVPATGNGSAASVRLASAVPE